LKERKKRAKIELNCFFEFSYPSGASGSHPEDGHGQD
jgi:hypothetical protein